MISITGSTVVKPLRKEDPSCLCLGEGNSHLDILKQRQLFCIRRLFLVLMLIANGTLNIIGTFIQ